MKIHCACQTTEDVDDAAALERLSTIRKACPVLSTVILPDSVWPRFQEWHQHPDEVAWHRSITLLALERQCLGRLTSPIHRLLFSGDTVLPTASNNYLADLRERWMHYADPIERHRKSRLFRSRVIELQYAVWLEESGHRISALEALGGTSDIVTLCPDGSQAAFELKFIGTEDGDFEHLVETIASGPQASVISPYTPLNYLLFRIYEAATQLAKVKERRIVTIIIDNLGWYRFQMQLEHGWIDWANPHFWGENQVWADFLEGQRARYPNLPGDLSAVLHTVDAVAIVRQLARFEFSPFQEIRMTE